MNLTAKRKRQSPNLRRTLTMSNLQVKLRIRPYLPHETFENGEESSLFQLLSEKQIQALKPTYLENQSSLSSSNKTQKDETDWNEIHVDDDSVSQQNLFELDRIMGWSMDQDEVFREVIPDERLQKVTDGYNLCVMAYGATGSGKTYTIVGGSESEKEGLLPRTVDRLFKILDSKPESSVEFSAIQIYENQVFDMISPSDRKKRDKGLKFRIREHWDEQLKQKMVHLQGVETKTIRSRNEFLSVFQNAIQHRIFAETKMNRQSSRSHCLFLFKVIIMDRNLNKVSTGNLYVVDLAGAENSNDAGTSGTELKQGCSINSSLLALSQVIYALSEKKKHIPYRNSVLTRILTNALGGSAYTTLVLHISPTRRQWRQSFRTLQFGLIAKQVENNIQQNTTLSIRGYKKLVARLQQEIHTLQQALADRNNKLEQFPKIKAVVNELDQTPSSSAILDPCDEEGVDEKMHTKEVIPHPIEMEREKDSGDILSSSFFHIVGHHPSLLFKQHENEALFYWEEM